MKDVEDKRHYYSAGRKRNEAMMMRISRRTKVSDEIVKIVLKEFYNDVFEQLRDTDENERYCIYGFGEFYTKQFSQSQHIPHTYGDVTPRFNPPVRRIRFKACTKFRAVTNGRVEIERNKKQKAHKYTKIKEEVDERTRKEKNEALDKIIQNAIENNVKEEDD